MILDFMNPVSRKYADFSVKSFESVSDVLTIEPFQCCTPRNPLGINFNSEKKRSKTELAILETYYLLFEQLSEGEKFIILEHDAYLRPDREDIFRKHLQEIDEYDVWNPGIAIECHTVKPHVAEQLCVTIYDDYNSSHRGAMSLMVTPNNLTKVLYVKDGRTGESCISDTTRKAAKGDGESILAPITQCYDPNLGLTNVGRDVSEKYNPINQPQFAFVNI